MLLYGVESYLIHRHVLESYRLGFKNTVNTMHTIATKGVVNGTSILTGGKKEVE